ncbi:MAG: TraR/DksA C4-type zinc finger protein [Desulfovibrionales bacterium]|nr:TraR/DksA C4-type zinc finger protein [Desulfovibrionales bacterium]
MTWNQLNNYRMMLEDLLITTTRNLEETGRKLGEVTSGLCSDENDKGSIETDRRLLLSQAKREGVFLSQIKQALRLLENGEYGICAECEELINPRRLMVHPTARYCAQCQEALEQGYRPTDNFNDIDATYA